MNFRHPALFWTLFLTEMWERFSYYGMRSLLVLFMTSAAAQGGLGFHSSEAVTTYGLFTAAVYLFALPGGWLADRVIGARRCVWYGGIAIALGDFILAIPDRKAFTCGLIMTALGTGLLKPNITGLVGAVYPEGGAHRDSGFSLFYMGINLGGFLGPLVCGFVGEKILWRAGFLVAGCGMIAALALYRIAMTRLPKSSLEIRPPVGMHRLAIGVLAVPVVIMCVSVLTPVDPVWLADVAKWGILAIGACFFLNSFRGNITALEKRRLGAIALIVACAAVFWAGFEQEGSSFTLFAERSTNRLLPFVHWEFPASWFLSLNAGLVILLSPAISVFWVYMEQKGRCLTVFDKTAAGLLGMAAGFLVMEGATLLAQYHKVSPVWLLVTYLLHTLAELCLSPVGLSAIVELAPVRLRGQMLGVYFLGGALGNLVAGLLASHAYQSTAVNSSGSYLVILCAGAGAGVLLLAVRRPLRAVTEADRPQMAG